MKKKIFAIIAAIVVSLATATATAIDAPTQAQPEYGTAVITACGHSTTFFYADHDDYMMMVALHYHWYCSPGD